MDDNDQILFDQFLQRNWGISPQTIGATATEAASMQRQQENANAVQQKCCATTTSKSNNATKYDTTNTRTTIYKSGSTTNGENATNGTKPKFRTSNTINQKTNE